MHNKLEKTFKFYEKSPVINKSGKGRRSNNVEYVVSLVPTGDWTDTYNLSITKNSEDEIGSVMRVVPNSDALHIYENLEKSNVRFFYRHWKGDSNTNTYEAGGDIPNESQAIQVATEDIDGMSDEEVADYLGIDTDEVNYQYRNDAIDKRTEELLELWKKEGYASGGRVEFEAGGNVSWTFEYTIYDENGEVVDSGSIVQSAKTKSEAKNLAKTRISEGLNEGEEFELNEGYESGGGITFEAGGKVNRDKKIVKYKDGRKRKLSTWNEGAGYTKDRKSFNKSEDWEIPLNERAGAKSSSSKSKTFKRKSSGSAQATKGKNYSYIPNAMLREAEIENKGKTTYIDAKDILDGIYVKAGTKYEDGGQADKEYVLIFFTQSQPIPSKEINNLIAEKNIFGYDIIFYTEKNSRNTPTEMLDYSNRIKQLELEDAENERLGKPPRNNWIIQNIKRSVDDALKNPYYYSGEFRINAKLSDDEIDNIKNYLFNELKKSGLISLSYSYQFFVFKSWDKDDEYESGGGVGMNNESILRQGDTIYFTFNRPIPKNAYSFVKDFIKIYDIADREDIKVSEYNKYLVYDENDSDNQETVYAIDEEDAIEEAGISGDVEVELLSKANKNLLMDLPLPTKNIDGYALVTTEIHNESVRWMWFNDVVGIDYFGKRTKKPKSHFDLELEEILDDVYVLKADTDFSEHYVIIPKNEINIDWEKTISRINGTANSIRKRKTEIKQGTFKFGRGYYDDDNRFIYNSSASKYSKGGRVKDYKYVPNYMIESVTVERNGKETEIDADRILDGLYVKGKVKFEDGGEFDYGSDLTDEAMVKQNLVNGEISCETLKEIIGCKPEYPIQIVGAIKLEKCFLRNYYRLA